MTTTDSLTALATDSHVLLREADATCKAHAANRNTALMRLFVDYGWSADEIATATGIRESTVRACIFKTIHKQGRDHAAGKATQ